MKTYSGKGVLKGVGFTLSAALIAIILGSCKPVPGPDPDSAIIGYTLSGHTLSDYVTDVDSSKQLSGLELSILNGSFDSIEWRQGSTVGNATYDAANKTVTLSGNPNYGDLTLRVYALGDDDLIASGDIAGVTYGPNGSEKVGSLDNLVSMYGYAFDSMSRSDSIGEGGIPEFYVQHYTFENVTGDLKTFADSLNFDKLGVDGSKVVFVDGNTAIGYDYANASSVVDLPDHFDGLLDIFKSLSDFESQYTSLHAMTPGSVNNTAAYGASDFAAMFADANVPDSAIRTSLVPGSEQFAYGNSDALSRYVIITRDSTDKIHVFGITQPQYSAIKNEDWLN